MPPGRIASSISSTGASRTASQAAKRSRRRRKATSRLRSLVDCESTVSTSSPSGVAVRRHDGHPVHRAQALAQRAHAPRWRPGPVTRARRGSGSRTEVKVPSRADDRRSASTTSTLGDQPHVLAQRRGRRRRPVLYLHGVPTARDDWVPFLERTAASRPTCPGFGRSGKRGDRDFTMRGLRPLRSSASSTTPGVERVRLVVHDWGAVGAALGPALPRARRAPRRHRRRAAAARLPLAPRRARVAHAAASARSRWG